MNTSTSELPLPVAAPGRPTGREASTLAGEPVVATRAATSDVAMLTAGTYAAHGLQFVAGLVQKAILGPVAVGYWTLMQTFWTFFSIAPLGAQHGATRQIPAHRGRGDFSTAATVAGTAGSFSLAAISLLGCGVALVAIVFGRGWAPEMRFGLVLLGVTAPLRFLSDVHEIILQSIKRFDVASATVLVKAVLALTVQTIAVYLLGFYGLFLGLVCIELGAFALWLRVGVISRRRPAFRLGVDRARLRELIRFGAPIMVTGQVWILFQAVDSLIVAVGLSTRSLGYYALAVSVTTYVLYLPKSVGAALFPRMTERFAQTGQISAIHHYASDVQRLLAYMLVPAAIGAGFFLFPVVIRHGLPAFAPAIPIVQIMVAATFFMALMNMPIKVLITAGYRWSLTALLVGCVAVNAGLNFLAVVVLEQGLRGAAAATALSYLLTFLATTGYSLSRSLRPTRVAAHIGEIVLIFAHAYTALRLIDWAFGTPSGGLVADAAVALAEFAAFLLAMAPWLLLAERRLQGLSILWGLLSGVASRARRRGAAGEVRGE